LLKTASASKKAIVVIDISNSMVYNEFESEVDEILIGYGGNRAANVLDKALLEIISGQVELSGLLPLQMPANMETMEV